MNRLLVAGFGALTFLSTQACMAMDDNTCGINVAISIPPIAMTDQVAFNINNNVGIIKSTILSASKRFDTIDGLSCSAAEPYTISATQFSDQSSVLRADIGQCTLKAGDLYLTAPDSRASVVFPQDFNCDNYGA